MFVNLTLTRSFQVVPSGGDPFSGTKATEVVTTTEGAAAILEDLFRGRRWIELSSDNDRRLQRRSWITGFRRDPEPTQAPKFARLHPDTIRLIREKAAASAT